MAKRQLFQKPMFLALLFFSSTFCFSQVTEQWVKRYNGPGHGNDQANSVVADVAGNVYVTGSSNDDHATIKYDSAGNMLWIKRSGSGYATSLAVDAAGNVYIAGYSYSSNGNLDYLTIKLDAAGTERWRKQYNGPGNSTDVINSLAVDAAGNVYVTGESTGSNSGEEDYATIKYDAAGNELWVKRYNGPSDEGDKATRLAVDASGNVYVTGSSFWYLTDDEEYEVDFTTIKYDAAGAELWVKRYDGPGEGSGGAASLAVDAFGNVYVTGSTWGNGTFTDYTTIKYDAAGNALWVRRYNSPGSYDAATALAVDASGNVYVTGSSGTDYTTIKYNATGNQLWIKRYRGSATSLAVDASGNVYVTGYSYNSISDYDYATVKYDASGNRLWVKRHDGPENKSDIARSLAVDASGNVYVTGGGDAVGYETDYVTIKYNTAGDERWLKKYTGPGNLYDAATSLAADAFGNVYVTGYSYNSDVSPDYTTIKYDAAGKELWTQQYNGPGNGWDVAYALAVDAAGNVYVTGESRGDGTSGDYATVKYDAHGNQLWVKRYNGPGNGDDFAYSLAVDTFGNVYVTGGSYTNEFGYDYATIKYDAAGAELWVRRYNGLANSADIAYSLATDAAGYVYVTGGSYGTEASEDYATIKYDAAGNRLWVNHYNGPGNNIDRATSLAVDASGNVYVTGESISSEGSFDYATVTYDAAGKELWVKRYNGPGNSIDYAYSLAVDAAGNVYVTGSSEGNGTSRDYATIKYDAAGAELWVQRYDGSSNGYDAAFSLAVDASGNVYVTGSSDGDETYSDYATVKYDGDGAELWVKRYNGPGNGFDSDASLAVDASGNIYVTGNSYSSETGTDYATIKYAQSQTTAVSSFTLINADTDEAIRELKEGDTLNLATLPTLNLNIRANSHPNTVGSVMFNLSGAETRIHTENIIPYALFADDNNGDYYAWTPTNGNYTLTATPYNAAKGTGEKGTPLTIHFTVTGTAISNLILINAETNQDIKTLQNGDVIDLAALPTTKLNIRAVVHPDTVGSVVFNLNKRLIVRENLAPYAIGGDIKGDYRAWTLPTGHHNLTATPYDGKYGRGKKGKPYSVAFTVVDMAATTYAATAQQKPIADAYVVGQRLSATPNPFAGQTIIRFSVLKSSYTTLQVYDMKGAVVEQLYQAQAEAGKAYTVSFDRKQLSSGVYMLQLAADKQVQSYKLVLIQ